MTIEWGSWGKMDSCFVIVAKITNSLHGCYVITEFEPISCILQVSSKHWKFFKLLKNTHTHTSFDTQISTPPNGFAMLLCVGLFVKVFEHVRHGFKMSFRGAFTLHKRPLAPTPCTTPSRALVTPAHCPHTYVWDCPTLSFEHIILEV